MKILTVSIAAYNVERYLTETLETLCDERYIDDIEVLIIDDGSKDNTSQIGIRYQDKYPNSVKYIFQENGGHGSTINKGIEYATGKYFRIIDGDDYVNREGFLEYIKKLKKCDIDMVITDYWWIDNEHNCYPHNHSIFKITMPDQELFFDKNLDSALFGLSTLSIKTKLLKSASISITEKCFYVDVEFIIWAIFLSKSYIYFDCKVYMYRCIGMGHNSTNKANMLKNVGMQQKVSIKMCKLFNEFAGHIVRDEGKKYVILNRIRMSTGALMRTFLLCDKGKESKNNIMQFDKEIKAASALVYDYLSEDRFTKNIRRLHYNMVFIIRWMYLLYFRLKLGRL